MSTIRKRCVFVTPDATDAVVSTIVRSTHRTIGGAMRAVVAASRMGIRREAISAHQMRLMQSGWSYTDSAIAMVGKSYEPDYVEITEKIALGLERMLEKLDNFDVHHVILMSKIAEAKALLSIVEELACEAVHP